MPDKPNWLGRLPHALATLESQPEPWVDRPTLEALLGVGRRRAQQILAPVATRLIGTSLVADRAHLIDHLRRIAAGDQAHYEARRREKLWAELNRAASPVLVELTQAELKRVELHDFEGLPPGVELSPGTITLRFSDPDEALQKLMALALAISRNRQSFDNRVGLKVVQVSDLQGRPSEVAGSV